MGKPSEIQFFGATTLHSKLMKYWHEVPPEMQNELKIKLLDAIVTYANGPKIVLNRLCISLSAFIVHTLQNYWQTAIEDVINLYNPNVDRNTQVWIIFEILAGVPEMGTAIHLSVQRALLREEISKRSGMVMKCIHQYIDSKVDMRLEDGDMTVLQNAAKCAKEWITNAGFSLQESQSLVVALLKLIKRCYWDGVNENDGCLSPDESELACACLKALTSLMIQPDAHRYSNSALEIMKLFLSALSEITRAEWKENNLNEDVAFSIYTLLISSTECHSRMILSGITSDLPDHFELYDHLVQEILLCTNKPGIYPIEESSSTLAMGFWYMLQDEVLSMENISDKTKCLVVIRPVYAALVKILVRKSQLPADESRDKWCADDLETFRCYRQDIADTILFCHEVLHDEMLTILGEMLDEALVAIQSSLDNWMQLEAVVHAFCALAAQVEDDQGYAQISKLMGVLNQIPYENVNEKLLGMSLETVGSYSEWLKLYPTFLPPAIELLLKGLTSSMSSQATLGLKDLTSECQMQLKPYAEPLLEQCQRVLLSGSLSNSESVRLMYSIGKLMSLVQNERITIYLNAIVSPCFEELQVTVQNKDTSTSARTRTIFRLNMISTLFSSLNTRQEEDRQSQHRASTSQPQTPQQVQPILIVLQQTMPIWKEICELWINDEQVLETLCGAIHHALTNLLDDIKPLLSDLCMLILGIFRSKCVSPAIEISATCIIMFCRDEHFQSLMRNLFVEVIMNVLRMLDQTPDNKLSEQADILETFYACNTKLLKRLPVVYAELSVNCAKLIHYALKGIMLPETGPIKKCSMFLATFVKESRSQANMTNTVLEKGEEMVRVVLLCIGGITPRTQIDVFAEIFIGLNAKYPSEFSVWLKALAIPNFPTTLVTEQEKTIFMKAVLR